MLSARTLILPLLTLGVCAHSQPPDSFEGSISAAFHQAGAALAQQSEPPSSACDRLLPRATTPVPSLKAPEWSVHDRGTLQFRYVFYRRAAQERVTAMVVESERPEGLTTRKTSWQAGDEILSRRDGPEGEGEPVCARRIRQVPGAGALDLHRLYLGVKDRLQR